tara:strand:+ start:333 stop:551 length:219 start_codon:yes stop_codon:yes gene_type:complete
MKCFDSRCSFSFCGNLKIFGFKLQVEEEIFFAPFILLVAGEPFLFHKTSSPLNYDKISFQETIFYSLGFTYV